MNLKNDGGVILSSLSLQDIWPERKYIIYRTTNLMNGMWYIGRRVLECKGDGYIGSGKRFKYAVKKYGKHNFEREILYAFDNYKDMVAKEIELVNEDVVNDEMSYNISLGGYNTRMFGKRNSATRIDIKQRIKLSKLGKKNPQAKLNWSIVDKIRNMYKNHDVSCNEIKRKIGNIVSVATIIDVIRNKTWYDEYYLVPKFHQRSAYHPNVKLTKTHLNELKAMKQKGISVKNIALFFGVSEWAIYKRMQRGDI